MKRLIIILFAITAIPLNAGVLTFTGKVLKQPAKVVSYPLRHPLKSQKAIGTATAKSAKAVKKVVW